MDSYKQVAGFVGDMTWSRNNEHNNTLVVNTQFGSITVFHKLPLKLRKGDNIIVCIDANNRMIYNPMVKIICNKDSIINVIRRGMGANNRNPYPMYNRLRNIYGTDDNIIQYIDLLADRFNEHDESIYEELHELNKNEVAAMLMWWRNENNLRRLYLLGLTDEEINNSYMSCVKLYEECSRNPYAIPSIDISKCQSIMGLFGKHSDALHQLRGEIVRELYKHNKDFRWSFTPLSIIERKFKTLGAQSQVLIDEYSVIFRQDRCYLKRIYDIELSIISRIENDQKKNFTIDQVKNDANMIEPTNITGLSLDQVAAVKGALNHSICVITGGAGTGKTRILSKIAIELDNLHIPILIGSFTGKAVARIKRDINPLPNRIISTLHSMIHKVNTSTHDNFRYLLIDETSMVTSELLYRVLNTYKSIDHIVLIGDNNQLQPIEWGSLFDSLVISEVIPVYRLSINHRMIDIEGVDGVITNANAMVTNKTLTGFSYQITNNFIITSGGMNMLNNLIDELLNKIDPKDFVVIAPYNIDLDIINKYCQSIISAKNPHLRSVVDSRYIKWSINDRVIMKVNDANINIFNGDIGTIIAIETDHIEVEFNNGGSNSGIHLKFLLELPIQTMPYASKKLLMNGEEVSYEKSRIHSVKDLKHAWGITIDSAQGSEWRIVVVFIKGDRGSNSYSSFMNRSRMYTAITRSSYMCWIVADDIGYLSSISAKKVKCRYDGMIERLKESLPHIDPHEIIDKTNSRYMDNSNIGLDESDFFD